MPTRLHVPGRSWSRREVLTAGGALALWPLLSAPASAFVKQKTPLKDYPFKVGVASGDPTPDGFVIWTRLAPDPLAGGGMQRTNVEVRWQVAHDEAMTRIAAEGTAVATADLAHSVHVEVPGLEPDRWYFYRFTATGEASPVGRARTAPRADALAERLRFTFASCQHFETGYFTAYDHMLRESLDLVVHLGDYIYEGAAKPKAFRQHVGPHLKTLADYRDRHAQYKTDEHLQAAHAMCPWLVTWDDHEFANNCAGAISEKLDEPPEVYLPRRAAAYQAYYEHMPLRRAQLPSGPDCKLYRKVSYGRLAEFAVLDTRQYRSDQPCGDGNKPPCDQVYDPHSTLLGPAQEGWLYDTLKASSGKWNVLAQQIMMARVDRKPGDIEGFSMDQWPGYEANRQRLLKFFGERPQLNPIVIAGDIHCNWANNLRADDRREKSPIVASEFVGTSITSGGDGGEQRKDTPQVLSENSAVQFFNDERGYVLCEATPQRWSTHYRTMPFVTKPDAPIQTRATFVVEPGQPGAHRA